MTVSDVLVRAGTWVAVIAVWVYFRDTFIAPWRRWRTLRGKYLIRMIMRVQEYHGSMSDPPEYVRAWLADKSARRLMLSSIARDVRSWMRLHYSNVIVVDGDDMPLNPRDSLRVHVTVILWSTQIEVVAHYVLPENGERMCTNFVNIGTEPYAKDMSVPKRALLALCRQIITALVLRTRQHPRMPQQ